MKIVYALIYEGVVYFYRTVIRRRFIFEEVMMLIHKKTTHLEERESSSIPHPVLTNRSSLPYPYSQRLSRKHLRRRGVVLIWVALVSFVMILLVGLSIDTAKVALNIHQMQNASDAASLAGAPIVRVNRPGARALAQSIGGQNFTDGTAVLLDLNENNNPDGDIVIGWYNRGEQTFTPSGPTVAANAVAVITTRSYERLDAGGPVGLIFGPIAGVTGINIVGAWQEKGRPYAIAMTEGGTGAGLIALRPEGVGLYMNGNFTLNVTPVVPPALPTDGEVQVNSESWNALDIDGTSTQVEVSAMNVTGDLDISNNYDFGEVPYTNGAPAIDDPLADLPEPTWNPGDDLSPAPGRRIDIYTGEHTFGPGYYSGGFYFGSIPGQSNPIIHFTPGIYVLGGSSRGQTAGLVVYSGANVYANEAMFYITGDGIVHIQGTGEIHATEPTYTTWSTLGFDTTYADPLNGGITIFQDRDNTNEAFIRGTADLDLDGTLYFPNAERVNIRGEGDGFGNQLIGWAFDIRGSGIIRIDYDGRNRADYGGSFLAE